MARLKPITSRCRYCGLAAEYADGLFERFFGGHFVWRNKNVCKPTPQPECAQDVLFAVADTKVLAARKFVC